MANKTIAISFRITPKIAERLERARTLGRFKVTKQSIFDHGLELALRELEAELQKVREAAE